MEGGEEWREGDQRKGKKYFMYLNEDVNLSCFFRRRITDSTKSRYQRIHQGEIHIKSEIDVQNYYNHYFF